jgi:plastocyanin
VRLRRRYLPLVALLGAALAVIPALANSDTSPTVEGISEGIYNTVRWSPSEVAQTPSGAVTFKNSSTTVMHGIVWESGPATPDCTAGVPVGAGHFSTNWSGSCTFAHEGTYKFYCSYHGREMSGTVYVNSSGTVPTVVTTTSSSTTTSSTTSFSSTSSFPTTTTTSTSATTTPASTTTQTATTPPPASATATTAHTTTAPGGVKPEGTLPPLLALAGSQHGAAVHGSADISPAEGGSRLEVDLLTTTASLARKHTAKQVRIGRLVRASVAAGKVSFSVSLDAQAKRALRRHHRLSVVVEVILTPPHGAPVTTTRSVVLHG